MWQLTRQCRTNDTTHLEGYWAGTATSYSRGEVLYLTYSGSFTIRKNIPVLNTGAPKWQAVNYLGSEPCSVHGSCKFVLGSGRQVKKSFLLTKSLKP